MTLALLLTAVTGAWATDPKVYTEPVAMSQLQVGDILATGFSLTPASYLDVIYFDANRSKQDDSPMDSQWGVSLSYIKSYGENAAMTFTTESDPPSDLTATPVDANGNDGNAWVVTSITNNKTPMGDVCVIYVSGTYYEPPITVEPVSGKTNEWTFTQPGSDVVLTPIYAKAAEFATESTSSGVTLLAPAAAEGVIAGTDAPLIVEGTGIVAFAGTSNEDTQGTVMYAVTAATATKAPELDAADTWSADVPTAEDVADDGAEVKVWYYIQGADAPQGVAATLDNTFNNSDIASLNVTVLSNKFDLTLKAANANTIDATDASKGTVSVKVGDAAAVDKTEDITNGKLTGIKMGSEVKLNAKQGYKFRKVEVKKKEKTYTITPRNMSVSYDYGNLTNEATLPYNTTTSELMKKVGLSSVNNSYNIQSVSLTSGSNVTLGTPTGTPGQRGYEVPLTITGEGEFVLTVGRTSNNDDATIKVIVRAN